MKRDSSIDIAKGVAILAIVLGHVLRGLTSAGIFADPNASLRWDNGLYSWHLATFAFLSGLFVSNSVGKLGVTQYLRVRIGNFVWIYLLWSLLQGVVKLATGGAVNSQTSVLEIFEVWRPEGQLWFFPWIIIATLIAVFCRPWASRSRVIMSLTVTGALALAVWGYSGPVIGLQGLALYVFYVAGAALQSKTYQRIRFLPLLTIAAAVVFVGGTIFSVYTTPTSGFATRTVESTLVGVVVCTLSGLVTVLGLSKALAPVRAVSWLGTIGRYSLEIFTAHILFTAGARILLDKVLHIESLPAHIAAGLVCGIVGPLVLAWIAKKWRPAKILFAAPKRITSRPIRK